jgi:hypothetical protein
MPTDSLHDLVRVSIGYEHPVSHIHFRISSSHPAPLEDALQRWNSTREMTQLYIAQCDEIWREHEQALKEAHTGLEAYMRFQTIPPSATAHYIDICRNTVAHRLIFVFRKADPDLVREFWDFAAGDLDPYLKQKNAFSHTPWEMMSMFPTAWSGVLRLHMHELHRLIPVRSWRETPVFEEAYALLPEHKRATILNHLVPRQVGLLCMLTTPEGFAHMVHARPEFLTFLTASHSAKYPEHVAVALAVAIQQDIPKTVHQLMALQGAAGAAPDGL